MGKNVRLWNRREVQRVWLTSFYLVLTWSDYFYRILKLETFFNKNGLNMTFQKPLKSSFWPGRPSWWRLWRVCWPSSPAGLASGNFSSLAFPTCSRPSRLRSRASGRTSRCACNHFSLAFRRHFSKDANTVMDVAPINYNARIYNYVSGILK